MKRLVLAAALSAVLSSPLSAGEDRVLDLPKDYRQTMSLYFTGDRYLAEEQTIRLYANDVALAGAKAGGALPDGSVLVAEIYAAMKSDDGEVIESGLGRRLPGAFKAIALMERKAGWDEQYPDELKVGDWEFEVFSAAGKNLGKDTTACRECHHPLADTDFLWSLEHLRAAAQ